MVSELIPATRETDGIYGPIICDRCGVTLLYAAGISHQKLYTLPASTRAIETEAFCGLPVVQITMPDGIRTIGARAFADCVQLKLVVLPKSIGSIADDAFDGCGMVIVLCEPNCYAESYALEHHMLCVSR